MRIFFYNYWSDIIGEKDIKFFRYANSKVGSEEKRANDCWEVVHRLSSRSPLSHRLHQPHVQTCMEVCNQKLTKPHWGLRIDNVRAQLSTCQQVPISRNSAEKPIVQLSHGLQSKRCGLIAVNAATAIRQLVLHTRINMRSCTFKSVSWSDPFLEWWET